MNGKGGSRETPSLFLCGIRLKKERPGHAVSRQGRDKENRISLFLGAFERSFTEFFHKFFELKRGFAGARAGGLVVLLVLESGVETECLVSCVDGVE